MAAILHYELTGTGWSKCTVRPSRKSYTFNASYESDALGSLVIAAISLLSDINTISFEFFGNDGTWIWIVERHPRDGLMVEIFESKLSLSEETLARDKRSVAKFTCSDIAFGESVNASASAVLEKHGINGYEELTLNCIYPKELQAYLSKLIARRKKEA